MSHATEAEPLSKQRLKAWIRLLRVTRGAEQHLREFLRVEHQTTLPRFDVMAALWRHRDGVTMSELSRLLLVSNGNATAIVDRLERDGLAVRTPSATDRRTIYAALTKAGAAAFERLAKAHEREVDLLFEGLKSKDLGTLTGILHRLQKGKTP